MDHRRFENRVLTEMAALCASAQEYAEVVDAVLDLVQQVVSSPYLSLSIQEPGQVGHYARVEEGVAPFWADEVDRYVAERWPHPAGIQSVAQRRASSAAGHSLNVASFPAETRSGRFAALTLASAEALSLSEEEEQLMLHLAQQAVLVLDHAILVQQLEDVEVTDRLTGLLNQRRLLELLDYELVRHRHTGARLALLVLDVAGLDGINRSYGHQYGNHILVKLAGLLEKTVRPIDVVARYGMDEFAIVLPETDDEEAETLADRLRERLLETGFAGRAVDLTIGVVQARPDERAEGFLRRGEQALDEAKRQERSWTELWSGGRQRARR